MELYDGDAWLGIPDPRQINGSLIYRQSEERDMPEEERCYVVVL